MAEYSVVVAYCDERSDDGVVVLPEDLVVCTLEAEVEVKLRLLLHHDEGTTDIAVTPGNTRM